MSNILSYEDKLISPMFEERESVRSVLQIFLKLENNIAIKVNKCDKVIDLKWKCYEIIGMTQNEIDLIFQGQILDDETTVEECELCEASVIDIICKLRGGMQIYARTIDGRSVKIDVIGNSKIRDIKVKFLNPLDPLEVHPDKLRFIFQSQILQDDKTFDEYGIGEGSCIEVVKLNEGILIFAKTEDRISVALEVLKRNKMSDLKIKIQTKLKLHPEDQKIIYQDQILQDDKTICDYGITEGSCIKVVKLKRIRIFAKATNGRTAACNVLKSEKISDVKIKIQRPTKQSDSDSDQEDYIPLTKKQHLFFQHQILQDDKTVEECGIVERSVINIVERSPITVIAKTSEGKCHKFEIWTDDKIIDLKKLIEVKTKIKTNDQYLMYNGGILEDDQSIWECEIFNQSAVDILCLLRIPKITINIRALNGQSNQIQVTKYETIGSVKKRIQETFGIIETIHLFYQGDLLKDDTKSVSECQIYNQSVIAVIYLH